MSENTSLYLAIWIVYILECLQYLELDSIAFISSAFKRNYYRPVYSRYLTKIRHRFLFIIPLFPPLNPVFILRCGRISWSPKGIAAIFPEQPAGVALVVQGEKYYAFEDITEISTQDHILYINGTRFVSLASSKSAREILTFIEHLKQTALSGREAEIISYLQKQFEITELEKRLEALNQAFASIKLSSCFLFIYLFAVTPLMVHFFSLSRCLFSIVASVFLLACFIAFEYFITHKKFSPGQRWDRTINILKILFYPPAALRAANYLSLNFFEGYHPLTAAKLLCQPETFKKTARKFYMALEYPLEHEYSPQAQAILADDRKIRKKLMLDFFEANGLSADELFKTPEKNTPECRSYCPRCDCQYTREDGSCPECHNIELIKL